MGGGSLRPRGRRGRKARLEIARRRERGERDKKSCYRPRRRRTCEATPIGPVDEPEESLYGARGRPRSAQRLGIWGCVTWCPSVHLLFLLSLSSRRVCVCVCVLSNQQGGRGGGRGARCQTLSFSLYFPYIVFFSGWQPRH